MALAAEAKGFSYEQRDDRPHRVLVDLDAVNDPALVRAAKNAHDDEEV